LLRRSKTNNAKAAKADRSGPPEADEFRLGVLVVNDDEDSCELLCRVIQHTGAVAFRAHSADGAIDELGTHKASVRAVVLDFTSGTATSFAVLDSIRQDPELRDLCVMIIATTTANRGLAFESGVDEFLTRPFHVDEFTSAVGAMLARSPEEREVHRRMQSTGEGLQDVETASAPQEL
jgi:DNA-binding response OmpR family regulator